MKRRRVWIALGALFLGCTYYFAIHPEIELAYEWAQLRKLGVPESVQSAFGTPEPQAIQTAERFDDVFEKWLDRDQSRDARVTGLTLASTAEERRAAHEVEQNLRPVLEEFELLLQKPNAFFEKDWTQHPSDIAIPEIVHFRSMSHFYVGVGYAAIAEGDAERLIKVLETLDGIVRHIGRPRTLLPVSFARATRAEENKLVSSAAEKWASDPAKISLLRDHIRSHAPAPDLVEALKSSPLFSTATLTKPLWGQGLTFGPKRGLAKEWYSKYVYSKPVRIRAEIKILRAYRTILSDSDNGKTLDALLNDALEAENALASDLSVSGQLAEMHFNKLSQVIKTHQKNEATQAELEAKLYALLAQG